LVKVCEAAKLQPRPQNRNRAQQAQLLFVPFTLQTERAIVLFENKAAALFSSLFKTQNILI
jgi:hypothetical protein